MTSFDKFTSSARLQLIRRSNRVMIWLTAYAVVAFTLFVVGIILVELDKKSGGE